IHQSIRISFASGAIATIVLSLFAEPILIYMYGSDNAIKFLILMAPFFILLYIQAPLQATLQALDLAKPGMWNSLIGAGCKLIMLFLLASNEKFGIMGVALAMCMGVVLVTLLHLFSLKKIIHFSIPFKDLVKMGILLLLTFGVGLVLIYIYVLMISFIFSLIVHCLFYSLLSFS